MFLNNEIEAVPMPDGWLFIVLGLVLLALTRAEDNSRKSESTWDRSYPITDDPNDIPDSTWREWTQENG